MNAARCWSKLNTQFDQRVNMTDEQIRYGWQSDFEEFRQTPANVIRERLSSFIADASKEQHRAWADSIPPLQGEVSKSIVTNALARDYSAILEYMLPMESRRPDVILLVGGSVMIVELKGKSWPSQADLDQVAAYARDLRNYHRECAGRLVHPVLVPTRAHGDLGMRNGVRIAGPDALHALVESLTTPQPHPTISRRSTAHAPPRHPRWTRSAGSCTRRTSPSRAISFS